MSSKFEIIDIAGRSFVRTKKLKEPEIANPLFQLSEYRAILERISLLFSSLTSTECEEKSARLKAEINELLQTFDSHESKHRKYNELVSRTQKKANALQKQLDAEFEACLRM